MGKDYDYTNREQGVQLMGLDMYLYKKELDEVAYWRKANAIHGWIINYTNSEDNCKPIELTQRDLHVLLETCIEVLADNEKAKDLLPPTSGFFFGSGEIDDWYWQDIKYTKAKLDDILETSNEDTMFTYWASW